MKIDFVAIYELLGEEKIDQKFLSVEQNEKYCVYTGTPM